ncbi:substrate-binding domain-containing protein [Tsukamurella soli]|uniref:Substrate-binding domain-containing protein n=1 Tax=Tsukamurella soli TaxID=644556 RepID=A0ABP8JY76_9ACTN
MEPSHTSRHRRDTVEIALVVPLSGPAGMFGPSCEACGQLAVDDLNAAGGILGRRVRLHPIDAGSELPRLAARIDYLVASGRIDGVVGWHLSNARRAITPVTAGRVPYVYTTFYEGGERSDGVYMVGETPEQQLFPAIRWLRDELGLTRWFIVGNDYVWPRETARAVRDCAADCGIDVAGEAFLPLAGRDFGPAIAAIRGSSARGVLLLLVGADCAAFNVAFADAGLDESRIRLSMMVGEDVLYAGGAASARGLYTASGYFEQLVSEESMSFGVRYADALGVAAPALTNIGESCYEGLLLFASLVEAARSLDVRAIERTAGRVGYHGPRGAVHVQGTHTTQPVYLASAEELDFVIRTELSP